MHPLARYLAERGISPDDFATRIGVANRSVVHKYTRSGVIPRPSVMAAIVRETEGVLQPNDFYALAAQP